MDLKLAELHDCLQDPALDSMNFLNEVTARHPHAVSFAPGRPYEGFFDRTAVQTGLECYRDHLAGQLGYSDEEVNRTLLQQIRLSCSSLAPQRIGTGLDRLAALFCDVSAGDRTNEPRR